MRCIHLPELLKDRVLHIRRYARTVVGHADADYLRAVAIQHLGTNDHHSIFRRELHGVRHEVVENLLQLSSIGFYSGHGIGQALLKVDPLLQRYRAHDCLQSFQQICYRCGTHGHFHATSLDLGHVEQFINHVQERSPAALNIVDVADPLGISRCIAAGNLFKQISEPNDGVQRRP